MGDPTISRVTSPAVYSPAPENKPTVSTGGAGKTEVHPHSTRGEMARAQLKENMGTAALLFKGVGAELKKEVNVIRGTKVSASGSTRASTTGEKVGAVGKLVGKTLAAAIMSPLLATGTVLLGVIGLADTACVAATRHRLDGRESSHDKHVDIQISENFKRLSAQI
ncbi:MAG: hypothetical protein JO331_05090 [Verrucomicrobia bacterium]|nr:hypothetical protein [Verrucomicrobiota bacterium]